ncbi:arsenate reductase (glutaredoxin) [Sulfurimonas sp.]|uniref:arsenate reductase (glutaredoxin) n=1 Tax=Sulfurimonas sp. TaxID=2022749 RepID=UPI003566BD10
MIQIWHNPRCSKSRASMEILESSQKEFSVKKYLDEDVSCDEIKDILNKLNISARELMRTKEDLYKELDVQNISEEEQLIEIMSCNPKLIERPIIIKGNKAVIGRPIENTIELLSS